MSELARRGDGPAPWGAGDLAPGRYSVLDVSSLGYGRLRERLGQGCHRRPAALDLIWPRMATSAIPAAITTIHSPLAPRCMTSRTAPRKQRDSDRGEQAFHESTSIRPAGQVQDPTSPLGRMRPRANRHVSKGPTAPVADRWRRRMESVPRLQRGLWLGERGDQVFGRASVDPRGCLADPSSAPNVARLRVQAPHDPKLESSLVWRGAKHRMFLVHRAEQPPGAPGATSAVHRRPPREATTDSRPERPQLDPMAR